VAKPCSGSATGVSRVCEGEWFYDTKGCAGGMGLEEVEGNTQTGGCSG